MASAARVRARGVRRRIRIFNHEGHNGHEGFLLNSFVLFVSFVFESFYEPRPSHFEEQDVVPRLIRDRVEIADVALAALGLRGLNPCAGAGSVAFAQAAVERDVLCLIRFDVHELKIARERRIEFVGREDVNQRGFVPASHELTQTCFVAVVCKEVGEEDDESRAARKDGVVAHGAVEIRFAFRLKVFEEAEQPRKRGASARGTELRINFAVL